MEERLQRITDIINAYINDFADSWDSRDIIAVVQEQVDAEKDEILDVLDTVLDYKGIYIKLNEDQETRDKLIFGIREPRYAGGIESFYDMNLETLKRLVREGFARKNEKQNDSPSIGEMIDFADEHSEYECVFDGYTVDKKRRDYRVSVEAMTIIGNANTNMKDAINYLKDADEVEVGGYGVYGWWD